MTKDEIIKTLYDRLNACHKVMDGAIETIEEWFPGQSEEMIENLGLVGELAENEELLIKIEKLL